MSAKTRTSPSGGSDYIACFCVFVVKYSKSQEYTSELLVKNIILSDVAEISIFCIVRQIFFIITIFDGASEDIP